MGNAVKMAARDAKEQIIKMAAETLEASPDDLAIKEGKVFRKGMPETPIPIEKILREHYGISGTVLGRGYFFPQVSEGPVEYYSNMMAFYLLGAHGVEVEVDRKTGQVKILKIYGAHDTGKAIHPTSCAGQIQGGASIGFGFALLEEILFQDGFVLNPSFLNYKIPSCLDAPETVPILVECAHPDGPYGAKGMGETTNVPTPPAIANAIYDAVGVRILDLPITPDKVLAALKEKDNSLNSI
jgi:xanthine dehydrogenase molybdenum-binding subunit